MVSVVDIVKGDTHNMQPLMISFADLVSARVPARLEPQNIFRSDGKQPDGISVAPWKCGKPEVWDATCCDTLAPCHLSTSSAGARKVAEEAENNKHCNMTI